MGLIISIVVIILTTKWLIKGHSPKVVLFFNGFFMLWISSWLGLYDKAFLSSDYSYLGAYFMMMFDLTVAVFKDTIAELGLIIMCTSAYAKYMEYIGASAILVDRLSKPLLKFNQPYIVLAGTWALGMFMGLCFVSAVGLSILLMVTMYPLLLRLGVNRTAAASVIASTLCLDWSPADISSIMSGEIVGLDPIIFWLHYKLPITIVVILVLTPLIYYLEHKRSLTEPEQTDCQEDERSADEKQKNVPPYYAIFPMLPLILLFIFNEAVISWIKVTLLSAVFISFYIVVILQLVNGFSAKDVISGTENFFDAMGTQVSSVIIPIVAGQVFAKGLLTTGAIDTIIEMFKQGGMGALPMMLMITVMIVFCSILMGSSNAPFFAFVGLAPILAEATGASAIYYLLLMNFASSIGRTLSPISSVMIATGEMAKISPFALIKRMLIPLNCSLVIVFLVTFAMYKIDFFPNDTLNTKSQQQTDYNNMFPQSMRNSAKIKTK